MSTIAQRIEAAKLAIAEKKSELAQLAEKAAEGEDVDVSVLETLTKSIEEDQAKVESLTKAESVLLSKSAPAFNRAKAASEYSFEKSAVVALKAKAEGRSALDVAAQLYGEDSGTFEVTKASTAAARTDVAGWAQELVRDAHGTFMDLLRPAALLPQLAAKGGMTLSFDNTNKVIIPFYNGNANNLSGAFISEGGTIPVKQTVFASKNVDSCKLGVITVCTSEILAKSVPAIEPILRDAIIRDTAAVLDAQAFSANAAGSAPAKSPAGLLNGVVGTAAAGVTAADVIAALKTSINAMTAAGLGRRPVAIMRPNVHLGLSMMMNVTGNFIFANELANGRLLGMDILVSLNAPANTIMVVDVAEVYFGLGTPSFSVSDTASLQMDNAAPTPPVAPYYSMFQNDMYAIRMITHVGWADVRGGGVQSITGLTGI
jgi:HK97 family phage major capsid protein